MGTPFALRLDVDERDTLDAAAERAGLNRADFLRQWIAQGCPMRPVNTSPAARADASPTPAPVVESSVAPLPRPLTRWQLVRIRRHGFAQSVNSRG
jgi:hypothetical protein